jgi:hypothetical protein
MAPVDIDGDAGVLTQASHRIADQAFGGLSAAQRQRVRLEDDGGLVPARSSTSRRSRRSPSRLVKIAALGNASGSRGNRRAAITALTLAPRQQHGPSTWAARDERGRLGRRPSRPAKNAEMGARDRWPRLPLFSRWNVLGSTRELDLDA